MNDIYFKIWISISLSSEVSVYLIQNHMINKDFIWLLCRNFQHQQQTIQVNIDEFFITQFEQLTAIQKVKEAQTLSDLPRIIPIPLEFECDMVDVLTKQLTSLNNSHQYRISYLGPRWSSSLALNKKLAAFGNSKKVQNPKASEKEQIIRYPFAFQQMARHSTFMVDFVLIQDSYHRNQQFKSNIYYRAFEGMNPTLPQQDTVHFDGSFESANLDCAVKVSENEYDLFLRVDSNTQGHTQWFYFSIKSPKPRKIRLNICNLSRSRTLYEKGMKPFILSLNSLEKSNIGWDQSGQNVQFYPTKLRYGFIYERVRLRQYWTLSFTVQFQEEDDQLFIAYCIPYTYSGLLGDIKEIQAQSREIMMSGMIGRSRMGLDIPGLIITDQKVPDSKKKVVLAVGRIHPGQTNGSIAILGMIKYLCSKEATILRQNTVFIIVPMVNPDGVVLGNSRTGVLGKDLNRQYFNPNIQLCPQLQNIKRLVAEIYLTNQIYMFLDFHGHSQRKNAFMFGPEYPLSDLRYLKCKVFPKLLSYKTEMFRYYGCSFRIAQGKESTGRAYMFSHLNIPYTYTVESSMAFFYNAEAMQTFPFTRIKWLELGNCIGQSLEEYFNYLIEYQEFLLKRRQDQVNRRIKSSLDNEKRKNIKNQQTVEEEIQTHRSSASHTKPRFASLLQQIRTDDMSKVNPAQVQNNLDSDSADGQDDMDPVKQANLNHMLINQTKASGDRPMTTQMGRRELANTRKRQNQQKLQKKLNRSKKEVNDFAEIEKQLMEQMCQKVPKSNIFTRKKCEIGKSTPLFDTVPRAQLCSRVGYRKKSAWVSKEKFSYNSRAEQDVKQSCQYSLKKIIYWNVSKQLYPEQKCISSSRCIDIGKGIFLPESQDKRRTRAGFTGTDWCNKVRKRLSKRQTTQSEDNPSHILLMASIEKSGSKPTPPTQHQKSSNIDYSNLLRIVTFKVEGEDINGYANSRQILSAHLKHRRQPINKRPNSRSIGESSDCLNIRRYQ